jgi:hypothetical protein
MTKQLGRDFFLQDLQAKSKLKWIKYFWLREQLNPAEIVVVFVLLNI